MFRVPVKKSYRLTGLLAIPAILILFVVSAFAAPTNPVDLGITTQYTQFIFGDVNLTDGSATEPVAYGGNAVLTENNIGQLGGGCDANATAIVVGGDLTLDNTGIHDGKGFVGGTPSSINGSYLECGTLDTTSMPVDFAAAETAVIAESARIATGITSGKIKIFDGCSATVEGTSDDFNIFTIDGSILENPSQLAGCSFNVQAECGSINVINVSGTTINTKNLAIGTFSGVEPGQILFNFYEATSLSFMGGGLAGTILAPNADVTVMPGTGGGNVSITGGLIAKSLSGTIASIPAPFGSQPSACSPTALYDFGDLPANYPTTLVQNGARHELVDGSPLLGTVVDAEPNGIPSAMANSDDLNGDNDHDGVNTNAATWVGGNNVDSFGIIATANGCLDGWIDWNENGSFGDTGEQIFTSVEVVAGTNTLSHFIPDSIPAGIKYARFRISPRDTNGQCVGTTILPSGLVIGGEVEDYRYELLEPTAVSLSALETADSQSSMIVAATFVMMLAGTAMLIRTRRD